MRLAEAYSNRRRTRLQRRGLGELLRAHPLRVHQDATGVYHNEAWCPSTNGLSQQEQVELTVRELTCRCWGQGTQGQSLELDLNQVAVILAYEDDIRHAERLLAEGHPSARDAVEKAVSWTDGKTQMRLPGLQEPYDAWIAELYEREERLEARKPRLDQRTAQAAAIRRVVAGEVAKTVEEAYTPRRHSIPERNCTRTLIGAWQYETSDGRRNAGKHVQKLVGHVGSHQNVHIPTLGRWTNMWVRDAERLLVSESQKVWNGSWELVVYGAGFAGGVQRAGEHQAELAPFVLKGENRQLLAVLPRTIRRHLAANGIAPVRCREIPGATGDESIQEVIAALWEPGMLFDSEGLDRLAGAAAALLA